MRSRTCQLAVAVILALNCGVGIALAQTTTAVLRGRIADENGPVAGASVVAIDSDTGYRRETASSSDGRYSLTLPPASYQVVVTVTQHEPRTATLRLQVGQSIDFDFRLDATNALTVGSNRSQVVGEFAIETRTSEIATNVTTEQIENLPQGSRNFLAFAALAPGVRFTLNEDETGKSFRSGGLEARQVNVFVDGLSYKNDLLKGGAFMQESSRGNPFPQNAVQEFRVSTQFKAEYEKAAAAVITAVTKSGGNALRGDAFYEYQDESMISLDEFARERDDEKPDVERAQFGLSVGGPLVQDRLHYFASFEKDEQDRFVTVSRGSAFSQAPANVQQRLAGYQKGLLTTPFDSELYFGKLSWRPDGSQSIDISAHRRDETEIRSFGEQRTRDGAESFEIGTDVVVARHQWMFGRGLNEAALTSQKASWDRAAFDPSTPRSAPHQNYFEILDTGGRDSTQEFTQDKLGFRDDFSFLVEWKGSHAVKVGASANWLDYDITKLTFDNPSFNFRRDENWQFPFEAIVGVGDPSVDFSNEQYGLYLQDDWQIGARLTVNLGVRWDYETNMINNDFVTPPNVVAGLQSACRTYSQPVGGRNTWCIRDFLDLERYTTDGGDRDSYTGMVQPRLGFSYDVDGNGRTVVFGAFGKYTDRVILNDIYDEQYRQSWGIYRFCFSATGAPAANCGAPTLAWRDQYLSADGLRSLIASGAAAAPEVFLVPNDLRPPHSTQWNVGLRQQLGNWNLAASYNSTRGENGIAYFFGDLPPGTSFGDRFGGNVPLTGLARVFIAQPVRRWWYDGVFVTADKPYTDASRWGFNLSYTYAKAYQNGTDNPTDDISFGAFDYASPADYTKFAGSHDERNRLILSGTVGLAAGFRLSTLVTLGSGTPYTIFDDSTGPFTVRWNEGRPDKADFILPDAWAYRSVDLRLDWDAPAVADRLRRLRVGVTAEVFNVFDFANYSDFESFKPRLPAVNNRFGQPNAAFNARRFQVGLRVGF